MTTFEFTTPGLTHQQRDPQTLHIDLCGQPLDIDRPKVWTLKHLGTVFSPGTIPLPERAGAMIRFVEETLDETQFAHFINRTFDRDDPLNLAALLKFFQTLSDRWHEYDQWQDRHGTRLPDRNNPPITITAPPGGIAGHPVRVVNHDLGIDHVEVHPPKDVTLMIMYSMAATGAGDRWAIEYFLGATFPHSTAQRLTARLNSQDDPLDVEHIDPMLEKLIGHWAESIDVSHLVPDEPTNREERRASRP